MTKTRIEKTLALQRAKETIEERLEPLINDLRKRAEVLERADQKNKAQLYHASQVPGSDAVLGVSVDTVTLVGTRWRGDCVEGCSFTMPLAYANGEQSEVDALAEKNETERKKAAADEVIRQRREAARRIEAEKKELARLKALYE